MSRILDFSDGFTSATEPTQGVTTANNLQVFASDAAYVTDKGSAAAQGDIYQRTDGKVRSFNGTDWVSVVSEDASGNLTTTNNLTVTGDLTVQGTTVTLNTQTLDVEDLNITINKGGNDASAEGAGLTVDRTGTDGSLVYDSTKASKWKAGNAGSEAEIVTVSDTQTLTGKTLTSPAITTPTGIVKGDVGLSNVDNTSDATKNAATATVTNKTFGDAPTFTQVATPSTPAAGYNKIYPKSDGNFYTLNSSGIETQVGSGAGGGTKNYLGTVNNINLNGNFELGATTGWSLSHTTLSSGVPNQASGSWTSASGNLSISAVTSGKLAGSYSLSMVSSAASTAGDMLVSDAFTIDLEDQAKAMTFKAYYRALGNPNNLNFSGTSSNTYHIYIYDVTNSAWIQPAGVYGMTQSSGVGYVTGTFQTTSNSTQYRLAVVNVNASAGAFTMLFDDFALGPQTAPIGAVITDWQSYTPTMTNGSGGITNAAATGFWRRVGDEVEVTGQVLFSGASAAFSGLLISIPSGLTINGSKLPSTAGDNGPLGIATWVDSGVQAYGTGYVAVASMSTVAIQYTHIVTHTGDVPILGNGISNTTPFTYGSGDSIKFTFKAPISGWSSNVQMSNDTDTRVVAWTGYTNSTQTMTSSFVQVTGFTSTNDTHGTFSSNSYTIPVSGFYRIVGSLYFAIQATSSQFIAAVYKNGAVIGYGPRTQSSSTQGVSAPFNDVFKFNAGDVITFYGYAATSTALNGGGVTGDQHWSITKESGPATIAASEEISARYSNSAGTSIANITSTILVCTTKHYDTHGAYNTSTGRFTCPDSGRYAVSGAFSLGSLTVNTGELLIAIFKNGNEYARLNRPSIGNTTLAGTGGSGDVECLAGDILDVRIYHSNGASRNLESNSVSNWVCFKRIK